MCLGLVAASWRAIGAIRAIIEFDQASVETRVDCDCSPKVIFRQDLCRAGPYIYQTGSKKQEQ